MTVRRGPLGKRAVSTAILQGKLLKLLDDPKSPTFDCVTPGQVLLKLKCDEDIAKVVELYVTPNRTSAAGFAICGARLV